jgi:hypothetical protein
LISYLRNIDLREQGPNQSLYSLIYFHEVITRFPLIVASRPLLLDGPILHDEPSQVPFHISGMLVSRPCSSTPVHLDAYSICGKLPGKHVDFGGNIGVLDDFPELSLATRLTAS